MPLSELAFSLCKQEQLRSDRRDHWGILQTIFQLIFFYWLSILRRKDWIKCASFWVTAMHTKRMLRCKLKQAVCLLEEILFIAHKNFFEHSDWYPQHCSVPEVFLIRSFWVTFQLVSLKIRHFSYSINERVKVDCSFKATLLIDICISTNISFKRGKAHFCTQISIKKNSLSGVNDDDNNYGEIFLQCGMSHVVHHSICGCRDEFEGLIMEVTVFRLLLYWRLQIVFLLL